MILRPVDASGDILPVLSSGALLSGPEAVALLVKCRLSLLAGEWWEVPDLGFPLLDSLASARLTDADAQALASSVAAYIRETPGVRDVDDVQFSVAGRQFALSCSVRTDGGAAAVSWDAGF